MLKAVRAFSIILALLIALPMVGLSADKPHPKKYGIEFNLGGSYYDLKDVNDLVPHEKLLGVSADEIHIGTQLGIGLLYRHTETFGWQMGYNKLWSGVPVVFEHNYKIDYTIPGAVNASTVEQKVDGGEYYCMATWYGSWHSNGIFFGIGPAIYRANLDRSVIIYDPDINAISDYNFIDASGKSFGIISAVGLELNLGTNVGLAISGGFRLAKVMKVRWENPDNPDVKNTVMLNTYSNATLPVDFTGGFFKVSLRTYFQPQSDWRSPVKH